MLRRTTIEFADEGTVNSTYSPVESSVTARRPDASASRVL
jgi:hypothetical protein